MTKKTQAKTVMVSAKAGALQKPSARDLCEAVKKIARYYNGEKRITCKNALLLAEKLGVKPVEVRSACDQEGIKIRSCVLGCF